MKSDHATVQRVDADAAARRVDTVAGEILAVIAVPAFDDIVASVAGGRSALPAPLVAGVVANVAGGAVVSVFAVEGVVVVATGDVGAAARQSAPAPP